MKKKLILISTIVLLLILAVLLVFKYDQKEIIPQKNNISETNQEPPIINNLPLSNFPETKWLSYQNSDLGITFNYPDQSIPNMYWTGYDAVSQVIRPAIKQTDLKICPLDVSGFKFSYPKTWGDCQVDGQKISFRTDFKKYNVDLVAEIRETSKEIAQGFMDYSIKQEKIDGINNAIIYRGACGGSVACSVLNINNQKFYEIDWDVVSNQSVPEDLDGVWVPDYSFTDDDIWTILRSISN